MTQANTVRLILACVLSGFVYASCGLAQVGRKSVDWKSELQKAQDGIEKNPKSSFWHNQAGIAYDALGDFESAVKEIKLAASLDPSNPNNYYTLYALYKRKRMRSEQRQVLLDALEKDADNPLGHFEFASILEEEKRWTDSLREYQSAKRLALGVKGSKYLDSRGNVYQVDGIRDEADKAIDRVTRMSKAAAQK